MCFSAAAVGFEVGKAAALFFFCCVYYGFDVRLHLRERVKTTFVEPMMMFACLVN